MPRPRELFREPPSSSTNCGRHFLQKSRRHAGLGQIGSIAPAIDRPSQDQRVHGPRHAHVAQPALFFDIVGLQKRSRVRKQAFFQAAQKHQRELQSFGGVQGHQRDLGALVVGVGIADQRGMVEKLVESLAAVARIHGGIDQFAQVLDAREGSGVSSSSSSLM